MSHRDDGPVRFGRGQKWRDEVAESVGTNEEHYRQPDTGETNGETGNRSKVGLAVLGIGAAIVLLD